MGLRRGHVPADRCGAGIATFGAVPAVASGRSCSCVAIVDRRSWSRRRPDRLTLLVALAVLALAFFALPTRVHERYGFPFFALGAILFAISWRWRIAYVVLSIATFANMYVVLTTLYPDNPDRPRLARDRAGIRSRVGGHVVALTHIGAFLWALAPAAAGLERGPRRTRSAAAPRADGET